MASWKIRLSSGASTTDLDLIDSIGPLNDYKFVDPDAFIPDRGSFTNQTKKVVPDVNTWVLRGIDIDNLAVGHSGSGDCQDSGGSFPNGDLTWEVIGQL